MSFMIMNNEGKFFASGYDNHRNTSWIGSYIKAQKFFDVDTALLFAKEKDMKDVSIVKMEPTIIKYIVGE